MSTTRAPHDLSLESVELGAAGKRWSTIAAAVGVIGFAAAFGLAASGGEAGWTGFFRSYLVAFLFFTSLALGALFFTLVSHLTRSGWNVLLRRIAENAAANLFLPLIVLLVPLLFGLKSIYPWTDHELVASDHLLHAKAGWLNEPFFMIRAAVYFGIWAGLARFFWGSSVAQDRTGDPAITKRLEKLSAVGMLLFALTTTFFAFDFIMSITPKWYSTIYGVYFFAGCLVGFFSLLALITYRVQALGALRGVISTEHYHDIGKLIFAFIVFWSYIAFSQFMLMWYANLPEETPFYAVRWAGGWKTLSQLLIFGHFIVPFFFLLSRNVKRRVPLLLAGAVWMLAMHLADIYWLVMPGLYPDRVPLSLQDLACLLGVGGVFAAFAVRRLSSHAVAPLKDPRLAESLRFQNF